MAMRTLKGISAALFAASAIVTAASGAQAATVSPAIVHAPASAKAPSASWQLAGSYLSKQVCLDHGYQYIQMGLATSYYCSGPFPKCPGPVYELWIYTSYTPAITIPKEGQHQRAKGSAAPC
jgi:hypothetical protein